MIWKRKEEENSDFYDLKIFKKKKKIPDGAELVLRTFSEIERPRFSRKSTGLLKVNVLTSAKDTILTPPVVSNQRFRITRVPSSRSR